MDTWSHLGSMQETNTTIQQQKWDAVFLWKHLPGSVSSRVYHWLHLQSKEKQMSLFAISPVTFNQSQDKQLCVFTWQNWMHTSKKGQT